MRKRTIKRRGFLKASAGAAIGIPTIITSNALGGRRRAAASDRIVMAAIGTGRRGKVVLKEFMSFREIQVVAVCDVKKENLDAGKERVTKKQGGRSCKQYKDYREMISRDDIDLILCATPDHWHAQITIDSCKTGKDVMCEKPLTLTIGEGRKMVNAARRYSRVVAGGSQRVLQDYGRMACAARSGKFGRIIAAYANPGGPSRHCYLPGERVPKTIDWDMWLGPAPWAPYNEKRCGDSFNTRSGKAWRCWYDYSGGGATDWGGHKFGGALHGLGLDHTGPVEVIPPGGENKHLTFIFANGVKLYHGGGQTYIGEAGEVQPQRNLRVPPGLRWYSGNAKTLVGDFIHCVKTRKKPFRDVEYAHRTATICHLSNICTRLKRRLRWDPDKEDFINDIEASRLVDRPRRGPWQI